MTQIKNYTINQHVLDCLIEDCVAGLIIDNPIQFQYPEELISNIKQWDQYVSEIRTLNKEFLDKLRNQANIYAIYKKGNGSNDWKIVYVGQRKAIEMRSRIVQHFVKKNAKTGSKLCEVQEVINSGGDVALSFIKVTPDSLRLYVEETIIGRRKTELIWNTHG